MIMALIAMQSAYLLSTFQSEIPLFFRVIPLEFNHDAWLAPSSDFKMEFSEYSNVKTISKLPPHHLHIDKD